MTAEADLNEKVDARFPIRLVDGRTFDAVVYCSKARKGQRRIVVTTDGRCLFDSGPCPSRDAAFQKLDAWLAEQ